MSKRKIITVVGARPQFIKAAALGRAIAQQSQLEEILVHSGQHYDFNLSEQFFKELHIPKPRYNLEIGSGSHNVQIAKFISRFDAVLEDEKPDMVIVFGDTNTTAAAALATAKRNIPLAHVEAGLREFDLSIPEEVNKRITDALSSLLFAPTITAVDQLKKEGKNKGVYHSGDISLDLLVNNSQYISRNILLEQFEISDSYIFMTCHRATTTANKIKLSEILTAASESGFPVIFPIHPRTKQAISHFNLKELIGDNVKVISPIGFWESQSLIKQAEFVITDSGGIIKEAYFHKTPAIIIDNQTEWVETVDEGWNTIAGTSRENVLNILKNWKEPSIHTSALGNGQAGKFIVNQIMTFFES